MAEAERPHRSSSLNSNNNNNAATASTTDLFICFTSRLSSSSSMRLSSKSILSPARSASLTTSLSRRLRTSGSLKNASASATAPGGGVLASPMFGANGRKRSGSGYDNNPEPSSPKVTCIGQVRVKTRKHVKNKMRARSRRKGETSFRRSAEQNDGSGGCRFDASENRWVHLPVTICESLRAFGSELNCFFPCRSSCTDDSHRRDRQERRPENDGCGGGSSCGAVFTRWFVAVEETGGKRREIELVVGGEDATEHDERRRSRRRHVFEGLDFSELDVKTEKKEKEEVGRIGICAPPKNALLLMRCRSDPVKVAALANKVRETQMCLTDDTEAKDEEDNDVAIEEVDERRRIELEMEDKKRIEICEKWISGKIVPQSEVAEAEAEPALVSRVEEGEDEVEVMEDSVVEEQESKVIEDSCEEEMEATFMRNIEDDIRTALEEDEHAAEMTDLTAAANERERKEEEEEGAGIAFAYATRKEEISEPGDPDNPDKPEPDPNTVPEKRGSRPEATEKETTPYKVLPDCLLLMMCEPKLSMEVSKETWVCSTDFVRALPERPPPKKPDGGGGGRDHPKKRTASVAESNASSRRRSIDKPVVNPVLLQPPRSSCSYPAAPPAIVSAAKAAAEEQKIAGTTNKGCDPPVLPRCKSEPRRSASKLAPEACFWKNRKLEPHTPATIGVGAAGVGF